MESCIKVSWRLCDDSFILVFITYFNYSSLHKKNPWRPYIPLFWGDHVWYKKGSKTNIASVQSPVHWVGVWGHWQTSVVDWAWAITHWLKYHFAVDKRLDVKLLFNLIFCKWHLSDHSFFKTVKLWSISVNPWRSCCLN